MAGACMPACGPKESRRSAEARGARDVKRRNSCWARQRGGVALVASPRGVVPRLRSRCGKPHGSRRCGRSGPGAGAHHCECMRRRARRVARRAWAARLCRRCGLHCCGRHGPGVGARCGCARSRARRLARRAWAARLRRSRCLALGSVGGGGEAGSGASLGCGGGEVRSPSCGGGEARLGRSHGSGGGEAGSGCLHGAGGGEAGSGSGSGSGSSSGSGSGVEQAGPGASHGSSGGGAGLRSACPGRAASSSLLASS